MLAFAGWISKYKINNFLEIGTYKGGTFHVWSRLAGPGLHISVSADLPMGPDAPPMDWTLRDKELLKRDPSAQLILADSQKRSTVKQVKDLLHKTQIDFLFIDGDHSQRGVHNDTINYGQFVRPGGIIAWHDVAGEPGPKALFQAYQKTNVTSWLTMATTGKHGIGAIIKDGGSQKP